MDEILNSLPFNTYNDLFNAIQNQKATIKIMRSDCTQIAGIRHPLFSNLGIHIGFAFMLVLLIFLSITFNNYWLLIWIPINFILTYIITYIPLLTKISWTVLLLDLFIIKLPFFIFISSLNIIIISSLYNIWWNKVYKQAITELKYNQEAFLWSWNRCGLAIEDCFGNTYSKLNTN